MFSAGFESNLIQYLKFLVIYEFLLNLMPFNVTIIPQFSKKSSNEKMVKK